MQRQALLSWIHYNTVQLFLKSRSSIINGPKHMFIYKNFWKRDLILHFKASCKIVSFLSMFHTSCFFLILCCFYYSTLSFTISMDDSTANISNTITSTATAEFRWFSSIPYSFFFVSTKSHMLHHYWRQLNGSSTIKQCVRNSRTTCLCSCTYWSAC